MCDDDPQNVCDDNSMNNFWVDTSMSAMLMSGPGQTSSSALPPPEPTQSQSESYNEEEENGDEEDEEPIIQQRKSSRVPIPFMPLFGSGSVGCTGACVVVSDLLVLADVPSFLRICCCDSALW